MTSVSGAQTVLLMEMDKGGAFDFSNCYRNMALCRMGQAGPKLTSTGQLFGLHVLS